MYLNTRFPVGDTVGEDLEATALVEEGPQGVRVLKFQNFVPLPVFCLCFMLYYKVGTPSTQL